MNNTKILENMITYASNKCKTIEKNISKRQKESAKKFPGKHIWEIETIEDDLEIVRLQSRIQTLIEVKRTLKL